jgi:hypothetical protein
MPRRKKQIIFCGCGGFYHYYIGVTSVLQRLIKDGDDIIFGGISAGCFPALFLVLGMDADELFNRLNRPLLWDVAKHRAGALFSYNNYARKWLLDFMPEDAYERASGRLRVSVTRVPSFENEIIDTFTSNEDLIDSILCSAYVPLFEWGLYKNHRDSRFVDGGVSDLYGHKFMMEGYDTYLVMKDNWRPTKASWFWCYSSESWAELLYNWGLQDAFEHMDELVEFLESERKVDMGEVFDILFGGDIKKVK